MIKMSWKDAMDVALNYNEFNKVTLIIFIDINCEVCSGFVKDLPEIENNDYQVIVVEDGRSMPFPPTSYPVGYIYIPNCPTEMPMQRVGNAPLNVLKIDSERQITAMKEGRDYYEVKDDDRKARGQDSA